MQGVAAEDHAAPKPLVQEIAAQSELQIPKNFIVRNGYPQPIDSDIPYMDNILIDLQLLASSSSPAAQAELEKLRSALVSGGCFQVINHGMSCSFLDEMRQISKRFFALPMEEKKKYTREKGGTDGYGDEALVLDDHVLDWNDGLSLTLYPEQARKLKYWPEKPENFKKMLDEYCVRMGPVFEVLVKAMARALGLEENVFLTRHGEKVEMNVRFNFYPRCPVPERVLGLKPHSDFSTMAIILQDDEVEGLQVMEDDQWFRVPLIPGALFANLGDGMEVMSNGIFKSTVHRVVTSSEKERISVAMFWDTDRSKQISPLKELVTDERPQAYKGLSINDYFNTFFNNYAKQQSPLDTLRISNDSS